MFDCPDLLVRLPGAVLDKYKIRHFFKNFKYNISSTIQYYTGLQYEEYTVKFVCASSSLPCEIRVQMKYAEEESSVSHAYLQRRSYFIRVSIRISYPFAEGFDLVGHKS